MHRFKSSLKISVSLALLTVSILLLGDYLGLIPDIDREKLHSRKTISELVAIEASLAIGKHDFALSRSNLESVVERQKDLLSAGLRDRSGHLINSAGNHAHLWQQRTQDSSHSFVEVPIFVNGQRWGQVELRFGELSDDTFMLRRRHPLVMLAAFVFAMGLLSYFFFMKRILRQLDPQAVIPERVRVALNTLAEGVLILDEHEQIVLANTAFGAATAIDASAIIGRRASELRWHRENVFEDAPELPWTSILRNGKGVKGGRVALVSPGGEKRSLVVNGSPILDAKGLIRGVIATFDDVTELESKNTTLQKTVKELEEVREQISAQNAELQILATRDPLTGCYNRRAFFELFERVFAQSRCEGIPLSCFMADIDKFKSINDTYGHATGDKVIKIIANILQTESRSVDIVGRYGGEEFCVVMRGVSAGEASQAAERVRATIENSGYRFTSGVRITSSFGVTDLTLEASSPLEMINQADKALYVAKETGRNRVVCWTAEVRAQSEEIENSTNRRKTDKPPDKDHAAAENVVAFSDTRSKELAQLQRKLKDLEQSLQEQSREIFVQSHYDPLTGLPNLMLFVDRIMHAVRYCKRNKKKLAVLVIHLSNFRTISDTFGQKASENLIQAIAERLVQNVRASDSITYMPDADAHNTFSRLGNDEFGILLTDIDQHEGVVRVVIRVLELLGFAFNIESHDVFIGANIGISVSPDDSDDSDLLLKYAGAACDFAKKLGPNSHMFYNKEMNEISLKQLRHESLLRRALAQNEFQLYYQPKVGLKKEEIVGFEALIRWNHPEEGWIPPNEFIPLAERCGLINSIGEWVIRAACAQLQEWHAIMPAKTKLAVNLSTRQLNQANLVDIIADATTATGLAPEFLELEITEGVFAENSETIYRNVRSLYERGFKIHIDDFGTGYSSLSYLKRFPADTIKIDRAFIKDITIHSQDDRIVSAMISMAHSMNMDVVAEGVETTEQLALLQDLNCDSIQGFLFSKPLPASEATALLKSKPKLPGIQSQRRKRWFG
jgi:diguanylate cyclase (GGDEF)-like protein/PAS domain S-box-containing protein